MRIVHVSHNGLPDPRVEKMALTLKKQGHTLIFVGAQSIRFQNLGAFDETHFMPVGDVVTVVASRSMPKAWRKLFAELKPDVIHAHNIIAARYAMMFDVPLVYDDHELWSEQRKVFRPDNLAKWVARQPYNAMIPIWEKRVVRAHPTLATNNNAAIALADKGARWVGVVPNVPRLDMVKDLPLDQERNGTVYVGRDFDLPRFLPHRDMTGLRERVSLNVVSNLPHRAMLEKLCEYSVGLTPWHSHPILRFKDQNRNYEYLHAGLHVFVNEQIKSSFANDPYVSAYRNYHLLADAISRLPGTEPLEIARHARKLYAWERFEPVIVDAYERATGRRLS
ncbi:MAG: glycosyltransferase [Myxococcota bacterium]